LSKSVINKPKVFISYAWGSKAFQEKVISFSTNLRGDGIDVLLDKWSLKEGNDTYAFMERCVNDPSITNVLILLDKLYKEKADSRVGGVGAETQIISPEIYNKVDQDKFIPIVFEKGPNYEVYKPSYLQSRLHFDLASADQYDDEYQRLVKRLYGVEILKKPELGIKPAWVDTPHTVPVKTINAYSLLKTIQPKGVNTEKYLSYLLQIKDKIINFKNDTELKILPYEEYLELYQETGAIRDDFLQLLHYVTYIEKGEEHIANFLEDLRNNVDKEKGLQQEFKLILIHEIFIYTIAFYYKMQDYKKLSYTLGKTYFTARYDGNRATNYNIFYSKNDNFDNAINQRDNKKYYSGKAQYWIENINIDTCSKNEFIFADLLCYNYALFGKDYHYDWYWFPLTYIYSGRSNDMLKAFATKLQSREWLLKATQIFGYNDEEEFKRELLRIEELSKKGEFENYRFTSSFDNATNLCDFIEAKDLGLYR